MNLRLHKGKVPIASANSIEFVEFPSRESFNAMYGNRVTVAHLARDWDILRDRASGLTLSEIKDKYAISRERARQIEAKFLRLMRRAHASRTD